MLRAVLLVVYLAAALIATHQRGSGWGPLGVTSAPAETDGRSGLDPLGLTSQPPPETDRGSGWDPLG